MRHSIFARLVPRSSSTACITYAGEMFGRLGSTLAIALTLVLLAEVYLRYTPFTP